MTYQEMLADLAKLERAFLVSSLEVAKGNKAETARALGVDRHFLLRALRRLGITVSRPGRAPKPEPAPPTCCLIGCDKPVPPSRWIGVYAHPSHYCSNECRRIAASHPERRRFVRAKRKARSA